MHRDQLVIESPCPADFSAMDGDARRRFCGQCSKHVHDLSAMAAADAEALVREEDDLCVRYEVDGAGEVVHRPQSRRLMRWAASAMMLAAGPAIASSAPAPVDDASGPTLLERVGAKVSGVLGLSQPEPAVVGQLMAVPPEPPPQIMGGLVRVDPESEVEVEPLDRVWHGTIETEVDGRPEPTVDPEPPRMKMGKIAYRAPELVVAPTADVD